MSRRYLNTYIDEFLWRRANSTSRYDAGERLLDAISNQYDLGDERLDLEEFADIDLDDEIIDIEGNLFSKNFIIEMQS